MSSLGLKWGILRLFSVQVNALTSATTKESLQESLKLAMRSKDKLQVRVIRSVLSDIAYASKEAKPTRISDILQRSIKTRNDSILAFKAAARDDLVETEQAEIDCLTLFLY